MKIAILTFHWATNYGAVLQSYALQIALKSLGAKVEIINYKPQKYDYSLLNFVKQRQFIHVKTFLANRKKEDKIQIFRRRYLNLTKRIFTKIEVERIVECYDLIISGSDQVLNRGFLNSGEGGITTTYYLDFPKASCKKATYAASFGITEFPNQDIKKVKHIVAKLDSISVRENSGINIFSQLGRIDPVLVPDPTLLLQRNDYDKVLLSRSPKYGYFYYMLQNRSFVLKKLDKRFVDCDGKNVESWLQCIKNSKGFITNSFHGVIFCLIYHVNFIVALQSLSNDGMNDRFFTLLGWCNLSDRIVHENSIDLQLLDLYIDWQNVDRKIECFRKLGYDYLKKLLEI